MNKILAWLGLSRVPFLFVGILPYLLGAVLAHKQNAAVFFLGLAGVVLIMLSTYYAGEYWDYEGDKLSPEFKFSGGTRVMLKGILPRTAPLTGSFVTLLLAAAVGLVLQFYYRTGPWTLPLGFVGMIGGFFYSTRPVRWVATGTGELWIAFCYGWLPVAVGYYLLRGAFSPVIFFISLPIACATFNVILLNEFSDYEADLATGKRNLTVRLGKQRAAFLYVFVAILMSLAAFFAVPALAVPYLPVFALSLALIFFMMRGAWHDIRRLEVICGLNILVNLAIPVVYMAAFLWKNI